LEKKTIQMNIESYIKCYKNIITSDLCDSIINDVSPKDFLISTTALDDTENKSLRNRVNNGRHWLQSFTLFRDRKW
jgi:hypothetical protein